MNLSFSNPVELLLKPIFLIIKIYNIVVSLVAPMVKHLPVMQQTKAWSLGWEVPLDKGMATPSSILAWRIPWTDEAGGLPGVAELDMTKHLSLLKLYHGDFILVNGMSHESWWETLKLFCH